jgi:hypothetical protein
LSALRLNGRVGVIFFLRNGKKDGDDKIQIAFR